MERTKWYLYLLMLLLLLSSCANTDEIRDKLKDHEKRIEVLEQLVKKANESTSALQALIDKMSKQLTIVKYEELKDGSGYVITMSDGSTITLKNGQGAPAPAMGIKEDEGVYYWTINGDYLLDASGNRVVAKGKDGSIGITPKLRINKDNQWEVSYDGGKNWSLVRDENGNPVVAVGSADTSNLTIESDGTHVIIIYNGVTYLIPLAPGGAVDPTSISLSPEVMTLRVGDTQTFALSFEPINVTNKEVTWASSNEAVATVDNGVVTAHTIGTAVVSAVSTVNGVKAEATVEVIASAGKLAIEYLTEYNINPAGDGFVANHIGKDSGYFTWSQAMDRFSKEKNFRIDNVGYHLPTYEEWCSIVPAEYIYIGMPHEDRLDSSETVCVGGQIKTYTSDYRFPGNGIVYAVRLKGGDNAQRSAWRYQYRDNSAGEGEKMLEITVRPLAEDTSVSLDDVAKESYWRGNNDADIVRRLPAAGYKNKEGGDTFFYNQYGHYWSATSESEALARFMLFSDFFAYSNYAHEKKILNTVRLFTNN